MRAFVGEYDLVLIVAVHNEMVCIFVPALAFRSARLFRIHNKYFCAKSN
jgi:hypothetical protein